MSPMPLLVGFGTLLAAVLLLEKAFTDASWSDILQGKGADIFRQHQASAAAGSIPSAGASVGGTVAAASNSKGETNPIPGATGSRLDQGMDATGHTFLAPFAGHVVKSTQSDPGWAGGGYVAIADALNPKRVFYLAEGIAPSVTLGQFVQAGQQIATPVSNPYNGIVGNVEIGLANPAAPGQPLAQVVGDARGMVLAFYSWLRGLGAPAASSTSSAGHG